MAAPDLHVLQGSDREKRNSNLKDMQNHLQSARTQTGKARTLLLVNEKKPNVKEQDLLQAFQELTRAEDALWRLLDQIESAETIGYLVIRRLRELLSDMEMTSSLPRIQLSLRILIQSNQDLSSQQALTELQRAHTGLLQFENELSAIERSLKKEFS